MYLLTLQRLHHDRSQPLVTATLPLLLYLCHHLLQMRQIIELYVLEARGQWIEVLLIFGLSGGCDSGQSTTMEAIQCRDDDREAYVQLLVGIFAG